jgi:biotin carboxyl carrier protein
MKSQYHYQSGNEIKTITVAQEGDLFRVTVGETEYTVTSAQWRAGRLSFAVEGQQQTAFVVQQKAQRYLALEGQTWHLEQVSRRQARRGGVGHGPGSGHAERTLQASMPGQVLDVLVAVGDQVERGQTLVLLEAMKMELRVAAPHDGVVTQLLCSPGEVVERGQVLVEVEPA